MANASQFKNSSDRLRFDLPATNLTVTLNRNNQAILSEDLGDVLLDLSVILRLEISTIVVQKLNSALEIMLPNSDDCLTS